MPFYDFNKYSSNFNTKLFNEALYVASTYMSLDIEGKNSLAPKFMYDLPELDFFLEMSFGQIIYSFQLEQIYSYYSGDFINATDFRKGINKKMNSTFEKAKEITVNKNFTLMDVINDRMILGDVRNPNYKGAKILNNLSIINSLK